MAQGGEVSAAWHGTQAPPAATRYSQGAPPHKPSLGPSSIWGTIPSCWRNPISPVSVEGQLWGSGQSSLLDMPPCGCISLQTLRAGTQLPMECFTEP